MCWRSDGQRVSTSVWRQYRRNNGVIDAADRDAECSCRRDANFTTSSTSTRSSQITWLRYNLRTLHNVVLIYKSMTKSPDVHSGGAIWWMLTEWRPGVVDWGGGVFASCCRGSNCSLARAMDRVSAAAPLAFANQLPLPTIVKRGRPDFLVRRAIHKNPGL